MKKLQELVFLIEYRVSPENAPSIGEVMGKMREVGSAEIIAVRLEKDPNHAAYGKEGRREGK